MVEIIKYPQREQWADLCKRPVKENSSLQQIVAEIVEKVRAEGDDALRFYSQKFDAKPLNEFAVSRQEIESSEEKIKPQLKQAIEQAKRNITIFHQSQLVDLQKIQTSPEVVCWQKQVPIQKVGLYIPGGSAPLFSTVLMLAIPAQIAECQEIVLCTPPDKEGNVHPAILYAAKTAGVHKIFKIGGAQAIAALAYGTESVPRVSKIFGPGNQFVTAAKQLVSLQDTAIDMPAGPSEVEIMADVSAKPEFVAADMLSQAEHGLDSQSILVTTNEDLIDGVLLELEKQTEELPRKEQILSSLKNSKIILVKDLQEAVDFTNEYAPEHLIISTLNNEVLADCIINAGSVFLGNFTPESAGDYASGTNHTLPTNGFAKMYSGVNIDSFMRKITFQKITQNGLRNIGNAIEIMAEEEGLLAHKNAVSIRLDFE
ncbi:MAG: histidinol dehydrogenase [Paludibacteraceae bacterium]|nr:histidinol dehydrogenase [Paludibacteraceae bacterium]